MPALANWLGLTLLHTLHIHLVRNRVHVIRIHTRRILTEMVQLQTIRYRTNHLLIGKPVS